MEGSLLSVCLSDLSRMGSHVGSGTALTPVCTPHPRELPGGDRVHALFSEVTRAPSSFSLSVSVSLPLCLFPHPLSSEALLQDTFLTAQGSPRSMGCTPASPRVFSGQRQCGEGRNV